MSSHLVTTNALERIELDVCHTFGGGRSVADSLNHIEPSLCPDARDREAHTEMFLALHSGKSSDLCCN